MFDITPIHAFSDNFIWLINEPDAGRGAVVDPGDAGPVLRMLDERGLDLVAIVITHGHADHVGGIRRLLERYPGIPVYGPRNEAIPGKTHPLGEGDEISIPDLDATFGIMDIPGHTGGHIAYFDGRPERPVLFCGDTLFSVGCGRVFTGTHDQLHDSLMRIADLPPDTFAYCAHEYTLDNIGFARWVEPENPALKHWEQRCHTRLDQGGDTVPSLLETERAANPFLRIRERAVIEAVERHAGRAMRDSHDTFHTLRHWKDSEYD
ncbi:MAG: hydroxyacylglutathione hydrolase [Pseudomonadota bacterium]|nr:hydroxyacylglutathione hydrolase [Pseudomonadota bacterium]